MINNFIVMGAILLKSIKLTNAVCQ